jgi:hypothetical protein
VFHVRTTRASGARLPRDALPLLRDEGTYSTHVPLRGPTRRDSSGRTRTAISLLRRRLLRSADHHGAPSLPAIAVGQAPEFSLACAAGWCVCLPLTPDLTPPPPASAWIPATRQPLHRAAPDFDPSLPLKEQGRVDVACRCTSAALLRSQSVRHNTELRLSFRGERAVCIFGGLVRELAPGEQNGRPAQLTNTPRAQLTKKRPAPIVLRRRALHLPAAAPRSVDTGGRAGAVAGGLGQRCFVIVWPFRQGSTSTVARGCLSRPLLTSGGTARGGRRRHCAAGG